jgi:hypothetical protein
MSWEFIELQEQIRNYDQHNADETRQIKPGQV